MNQGRPLVAFPIRRLATLYLLLLAACATGPLQPGDATTGPQIQASPQVPLTTSTPRPDPTSTLTPVPPAVTQPVEVTAPPQLVDTLPAGIQPCPKDVLDAYLATLDPIAAQHLQDAKIAQTVETLDEGQIEDYRRQAEQRLETLRRFVPPDCARMAHEQFIAGFEKLVQAWEAAGEKDIGGAKEILRSSYEDIAGAIAILTGN